MKKHYSSIVFRALLLFCLFLGIQNRAQAQTTLVAGDILFTSYSGIAASGTPDTFSFVILTPISSGTVIYFTERGYQGGSTWQASGTTEGTISWTSGSALAIGQEVEIAGLGASAAKVNGTPNGTVATVLGGNVTSGLSLSNAGDQIMAFQGGAGDPTSGSAVYICGINWALSCGTTSVAGWNGAGCSYGPQTSTMPPGLTGGTNAFLAGTAGATPNNDHGKFNCTGTPYSTVAALKTAIMTLSNWVFSNTGLTVHNVPPGCNYYATCTNPTINTQPSNSTVCNTGNTTFSISATGATGYQWQENTGSGFTNISNGGVYSNATTATLTITGATSGMNGYLYRCIASDGACSTTSSQATLTVSTPSITAASQTNVACNGGSTGAASVNAATGGTGGYTYNWTPGNPTGDGTVSVSGLTAGSWTCTVTDANSCTGTRTFTITQPPALSLTAASQTNVACNGGSTGAASVNTATGGAGGYTYNWTPGNPTGDGTVSVTGLTAGTWTCTVTDANACTTQRTFTVTQPTAISLTAASQTNIACNGGSNGAASVNAATGGAGGFTYNWTPGNPTGDGTVSVTGLTAGTWTCTVTDANSCTAQQTFTVTQPTAISLTAASQTNIACNGGSNGAASVNTATGGAGGYTYDWSPGTPTGDGTVSVTGLTAGTWTCTVMDANACTAQQTFTVTQPTAISLTAASQTNIACNGGSNGAASVNTATGGAGGYTYNWTPGNPTGDGTVSVTGLTAGTWTCTVMDANACTAQQTFTVTQPTTLSLTAASQTNVACNGGSNGAASVNTATGGAGGYTYNWTPGNPTGDGTVSVSGLTAGTWTCTVTDANACTAQQTFTVTQPTAISITAASQTNISCNGGSNGAASVNAATGGAGGFTYNWTPGNPTGDGTVSVTGLTAGTWTCTTTDANSCTAQQTFTITQPTAISLTAASQTNIACNGGSTGAASVNAATGGAGGYTYDWTPGSPTGDGTVSVTGLTAGTWTCTVTDANACTTQRTFTITQPTVLGLTAASQTNVSCNGGSNGAASVNTATGGAGGYTYNWTPGNPTGDGTVSVTGLTAGTWTCTVTDANACTAQQTFTVTQPTALSLTAASQTNVACNGGSTGAASVNTATGGAGGYTYNWTPGNPTGDGTVSVSGLTAGTWTCTVTDANSCTAQQTFTVTQPTAITASSSSTATSCSANTGTATVSSVSGGAGGYTYSWAPSGGTGATATGLAAGSYTCTITDANSCSITEIVSVSAPAGPSLTAASQTNIACNGGSNGAASVNAATGGAGGYTYDWTPGTPTGDGTVSVTGLTAGTWTCTVTDAGGCTAQQIFTVTQPTALSLTAASQTNIACNGGSNGAASVNTATGGAGGYTYDWTPGNPTGDGTVSVTGLTAGTWTCTVTDANACTTQQTFTVTQPAVLSLTAASQTNVSCNGGSNGAASVNTATGGAGGYTYNWTPGNPTGDGTVSVTGLTAGTWTCTVTDANSCTAQQTFTVTEPTALSLTAASQTNVSCNSGSNGAASVNAATGGAGGYTYDWTPGTPTGDGTVSVTGLTAGTWTCTVTDANSCTAQQTFTVTQPTAINMTAASQTNVSCNGGSNGAASVNVSGGAGGYTYDWTPGSPTGDGTGSVSGLTAGTWTCNVTDANGCTATQNFTITEPSALIVSALAQTNVSCNSGSNGAASVSVSGGTTSYSYDWTPGTPTGDGTASVTGLTAGTWTCNVTDANGCTATQNFTITEPNVLTASIATQTNVTCNGGANGTASVNVSGGTTSYSYDWTPGTPTGDGTGSVSGLTAGTWVCNITDANGCTTSQSVTITEPAVITSTMSQTACNSYTLNGQTYTTSGSYNQTLVAANGCDSILTLNLTVNYATASTLNESACASYTLNGQTYTASGTYTQTLTNAVGCDSTITLNLTINNTASTLTETACDSYTLNSQTYTTSGVYTQTLTNAAGCDSTITLNLTINNSTTSTITETACDSYTLNSQTYTTSGVYTQTLTNAAGCDSTITLNLTINNSTTSTLTETACDSFTLNNETYTTSGVYTQTLTNAAGCDSIITLNLTINNSTSSSVTEVACDSYDWNGQTYTASGVYSLLFTNAAGCDSTATLNLTINNSSSSTLTAEGCESYTVNGETFTASGTYTQVLTNAAGCDSIITLNLTIFETPVAGITQIDAITLQASGTATGYQWINCNTGDEIAGATNQTFVATADGSYAVIVYNGPCEATSSCIVIDEVGITENTTAFAVQLAPNPTDNLFTVKLTGVSNASVVVYDSKGRIVLNDNSVSNGEVISLGSVETGVYMVRVATAAGTYTERLIKQ